MFYITEQNVVYWGKWDQRRTKITIYAWNRGNWQYYGTYSAENMKQAMKHKQIRKLKQDEQESIIENEATHKMKQIQKLHKYIANA